MAEGGKWEESFKKISSPLAVVGGCVAVFYALGFLIVQCFISSANVGGMFFFSREYYEEAGGKFLVDLMRTPLMNPLFTFLYLAFLVYLVPSRESVSSLHTPEGTTLRQRIAGVPAGDAIRAAVLVVIVALTYVFMAYFERAHDLFVVSVGRILVKEGDALSQQDIELRKTLLFFGATVPAVVVLGLSLRRLLEQSTRKGVTGAVCALYVMYVAVLPISYGRYLYDIRAVQLEDPSRIEAFSGTESGSEGAELWFLGRFGGKCLFVRTGKSQPVVESLDEKDVKHMSFSLEHVGTLRVLMKSGKSLNGEFARQAQDVQDVLLR